MIIIMRLQYFGVYMWVPLFRERPICYRIFSPSYASLLWHVCTQQAVSVSRRTLFDQLDIEDISMVVS